MAVSYSLMTNPYVLNIVNMKCLCRKINFSIYSSIFSKQNFCDLRSPCKYPDENFRTILMRIWKDCDENSGITLLTILEGLWWYSRKYSERIMVTFFKDSEDDKTKSCIRSWTYSEENHGNDSSDDNAERIQMRLMKGLSWHKKK